MPRAKSSARKSMSSLSGAHRTVFDKTAKGGSYYIRWATSRHAGAIVIGRYQAKTRAEAEALEHKDRFERVRKFAAALERKPDVEKIGGILSLFEQSSDFAALSDNTKRTWKNAIKLILKSDLANGDTIALQSNNATRMLIRWRDKIAAKNGPRAADFRMQVLKRAFNWARTLGYIPHNPALGIADVHHSDRSHLIWEPQHIEAALGEIKKQRAAAIKDDGANLARILHRLSVAEDALLVALNTGLRLEDFTKLSKPELRKADGSAAYTAIVLAPRKSERRARTAGKKPRVAVIPILPAIAPIIAARATASADYLFTTYVSPKMAAKGATPQPYTPGAIGAMLAEIATKAKVERHVHDTRGTFVTYVRANNILTREETADVLGWTEEDVRDIERRYLSNDAVVSATLARLQRLQESK